jgi:hypothetical protein
MNELNWRWGPQRDPLRDRRGGRRGAPQRDHPVHVHRADAQRREPRLRGSLSPYAGIEGQVFVFFVIAVAAAEAAVGLAIIISIFRHAERWTSRTSAFSAGKRRCSL